MKPSKHSRLELSTWLGMVLVVMPLIPRALASVAYPERPVDIPEHATTAQVDDFAWRLFISLNWPNQLNRRGQPDTNQNMGATGPRVWETFKNSDQIFLSKGADPGPWNSNVTNNKLLQHTSKATREELRLLHINQAVGAPLTDQHRNLVYYEKGCNQISYDYIRSNQFYDAYKQRLLGPIKFPFGSTEVKAAWRIMTSSDNTNRYYCTSATLKRNDSVPEHVMVGLVGFHITIKTPNAPQWVWATFEQVDNVPPVVNGVRSSFHNPTNHSPENAETPIGTPTQVVRELKSFAPETVNANNVWRQKLSGTVWQYYQLIGAQRPTNPHDPATYIGDPEPTLLANTVLETYIQSASSCMACHSTAHSLSTNAQATTDFSFLLIDAQSSK